MTFRPVPADEVAGDPRVLRGITVTQPWASLIAAGVKRIETRKWKTPYRGPLAIHAGLGLQPVGGPRGLNQLCRQDPFFSLLTEHAETIRLRTLAVEVGTWEMALPRGAIVAIVNLERCVEMTAQGIAALEARNPTERALGHYEPGRYAWVLTNVRAVEPLTTRGALGLWTVPLAAQHILVGPPKECTDAVA